MSDKQTKIQGRDRPTAGCGCANRRVSPPATPQSQRPQERVTRPAAPVTPPQPQKLPPVLGGKSG